ncbi:hypothetical protein [Celeribacter neptunius]|uniref:hypothetical protein n=1 Tax=Celeribacter neptunius TaxID=588602 RepID=UPI000B7FB7CC|nr:hypothetical protein [Celeribacter neptunius]
MSSKKRIENGKIVARDLFLPASEQSDDLVWALQVLAAQEPHIDDCREAIEAFDKAARARLPGANAAEIDAGIISFAKALNIYPAVNGGKLILFRKGGKRSIERPKQNSGGIER